MDTTRDAAPIRLAGRRPRPRRLDPPPRAPAPNEGEPMTTAELLELIGANEPPPPPDWWRDAWHRRQRRLRVRLQRYLRDGAQTTYQLSQRTGDFDREETEYALADLAADGVVVADMRLSVRRGEADPRPEAWWRLADETAPEAD